jgi:hypothetical protein
VGIAHIRFTKTDAKRGKGKYGGPLFEVASGSSTMKSEKTRIDEKNTVIWKVWFVASSISERSQCCVLPGSSSTDTKTWPLQQFVDPGNAGSLLCYEGRCSVSSSYLRTRQLIAVKREKPSFNKLPVKIEGPAPTVRKICGDILLFHQMHEFPCT